MNNQQLKFRTLFRHDGDKLTVICGADDGTKGSKHKFANIRSKRKKPAGHDPGFVYLLFLPQGPYSGFYKIGKTEFPIPDSDEFDLDEIEDKLLKSLYKRIKKLNSKNKPKDTDAKYHGARFIHAIRVACGEGAEKQPHAFYKARGKYRGESSGHEVFELDKSDIEIFKNATGCILGHCIKHLTGSEFTDYLRKQNESEETFAKWIIQAEGVE